MGRQNAKWRVLPPATEIELSLGIPPGWLLTPAFEGMAKSVDKPNTIL